MRSCAVLVLLVACVATPLSGDSEATVNSSFSFSGYTWSGGDKIYFYPWVTTVSDGYDVGDGSWYPYSLFSATSASSVSTTRFNTDLYHWTTTGTIPSYFWQDGYTGSQVYLKAKSSNHSWNLMSFDASGDMLSCLSQASGWDDFATDCAGERSPGIRLETDDFIPWADRGRVDCPHNGIAGCTLCVDDVVASFQDVFRDQLMSTTNNYASGPFTFPAGGGVLSNNHIQGFTRLANVDVGGPEPLFGAQPLQGRTVISRDRPAQLGVFEEWVYAPGLLPELASPISQLASPIITIDTILDHPGGIWASGDVVGVPVGCQDCVTSYNEVIFYRANDYELMEINRLVLDGSQGEPYQTFNDFAQSVAFTKLRGGRYLLFIAGPANSGGYFYVSDSEEIEPGTNWTYINYWTPPCADDGSISPNCFGGAAQSTMFTQCDGRIFIGALHGNRGSAPVLSWATVLEVVQSHSTGTISLLQHDRGFVEGDNGIVNDDVSMFWGGTVHVTERGTLVGNATERDFDLGSLQVDRAVDCDEDPQCP